MPAFRKAMLCSTFIWMYCAFLEKQGQLIAHTYTHSELLLHSQLHQGCLRAAAKAEKLDICENLAARNPQAKPSFPELYLLPQFTVDSCNQLE